MKYSVLLTLFISCNFILQAQDNYPDPEFSKEIYFLDKSDTYSLVRLEKGSSELETKTKAGGFGGAENGYALEKERSGVRFPAGRVVSFVYSTGASAKRSANQDSIMEANGIDPSMMGGGAGMMDPLSMIILYKAESGKGQRKIILQKSPGAFGYKKMKHADKCTFSVKKIREGYWELVLDKPLPKGEYAFSMGMGMGSMDPGTTLYAFGAD